MRVRAVYAKVRAARYKARREASRAVRIEIAARGLWLTAARVAGGGSERSRWRRRATLGEATMVRQRWPNLGSVDDQDGEEQFEEEVLAKHDTGDCHTLPWRGCQRDTRQEPLMIGDRGYTTTNVSSA